MARLLPLFLLVFFSVFAAAATLDERANSAFSSVHLRPEQKAPYETMIRDYYQHMYDMVKRASWQNSGEMLQKLVRNRGEKISDDTMKQAAKLLDDKQLDELRYALDLANRSFVEAVGGE